jgi:DNA-binding beta-propeller fold protein YncE
MRMIAAPLIALGLVAMGFAAIAQAAPSDPQVLPTDQSITPTAAPGAIFQRLNPDLPALPDFTAGQASAVALSPDGRTLLILTSGYNRNLGPDGKVVPALSNEYVFVYDVSGAAPVKRQVIDVPDSFQGLVWSPSGARFYVSGGVDDDVLEFAAAAGRFTAARTFHLGHKAGLGVETKPGVAGLAISPDGRRLLAANMQNESVSLIDLVGGAVRETDLRPGVINPARVGAPGGTFPSAVAFASNHKAYVGSLRDREIIILDIVRGRIHVAGRLKTRGQPTALLVNPARTRLFAALDNTDAALAIDPARGRIVESIPTVAPARLLPKGPSLGGAGSNGLALTPDGRTLLVTNGGQNDVAVIRLSDRAAGLSEAPTRAGAASSDDDGDGDDDDGRAKGSGPAHSAVIGLIPTGWYPTGVAVARDASRLYVVNGKSMAGPNPANCRNNLATAKGSQDACHAANQYVWQLQKAGFLTLPTPSPAQLGILTRQAAANNHLDGSADDAQAAATLAFMRAHIRHVIYIVKENRTYDQVLGDLPVGNGDPNLAVFGAAMTPNQHALARQFVDLDAFYDSGESSNTGWDWTTAARTNDFSEREAPVNYGQRGLQYDQEGTNRDVNVAFATPAERIAANPATPPDPNLLAGTADVAAPDGPGGAQGEGYIWDSAIRAGVAVRNYGFFGDLERYDLSADDPAHVPLERDPHAKGLRVFYPSKPALMDRTDPYFRGFDQSFPDYWRFKEWEREFDGFVAAGSAPGLILLRLPHDHTGDFGQGLDGVDTVETEIADNDYAVGLVAQKLAHSPFAKDTLIFVVEDDAQDGPDHVDAHRSLALVIGPYVRQGAVISRHYDTVALVRTIEAVLGLSPMGLNDAMAAPMSAVFDPAQADWTYQAKVPAVLRTTALPLPPPTVAEAACRMTPVRSAAWWSAAMAGQDFSREDHLDTAAYNRALWRGLKGDRAAFPTMRDGRDLSKDRPASLETHDLCGASAP